MPLTCGPQGAPSDRSSLPWDTMENCMIKPASWHSNKPKTKQILRFAFLLSTFHQTPVPTPTSWLHLLHPSKWHQHSTSWAEYKPHTHWAQRHMPVVPALRKPGQKNCLKFESSLGYRKKLLSTAQNKKTKEFRAPTSSLGLTYIPRTWESTAVQGSSLSCLERTDLKQASKHTKALS